MAPLKANQEVHNIPQPLQEIQNLVPVTPFIITVPSPVSNVQSVQKCALPLAVSNVQPSVQSVQNCAIPSTSKFHQVQSSSNPVTINLQQFQNSTPVTTENQPAVTLPLNTVALPVRVPSIKTKQV